MPDSQALLALALVAVYLLDSAHLLAIGDALVITRGGRLRQLSFGWTFELAGRRPYLPNPLTPFWPELPIQWTSGAPGTPAAGDAAGEMLAFLTATRQVSGLAAIAGLFIVVVAPTVLAAGSARLFIIAAAISFVFSLWACCLAGARRSALGLSLSQIVATAALALVCLPCSANLGRALARHRRWTLVVSDIPSLGFEAADGDEIARRVSGFLGEVRRLFPEGTAEFNALTRQMERLERTRRESR